jgi:hypothetical protein
MNFEKKAEGLAYNSPVRKLWDKRSKAKCRRSEGPICIVGSLLFSKPFEIDPRGVGYG